jgi:hypothetical protein
MGDGYHEFTVWRRNTSPDVLRISFMHDAISCSSIQKSRGRARQSRHFEADCGPQGRKCGGDV